MAIFSELCKSLSLNTLVFVVRILNMLVERIYRYACVCPSVCLVCCFAK